MTGVKKHSSYFDNHDSSSESDSSDSDVPTKLLGTKRKSKGKEPEKKRHKKHHKPSEAPTTSREKVPQQTIQVPDLNVLREEQQMLRQIVTDLSAEVSKLSRQLVNFTTPQNGNHTNAFRVISSSPEFHEQAAINAQKQDFARTRQGEVAALSEVERKKLLKLLSGMNAFYTSTTKSDTSTAKSGKSHEDTKAPASPDSDSAPVNLTVDMRLFFHLRQAFVANLMGVSSNAISRAFQDFFSPNGSTTLYSWPSRGLTKTFEKLNNYLQSLTGPPNPKDKTLLNYQDELLFHVVSPVSTSLLVPESFAAKYKRFSWDKLNATEDGNCPELLALWSNPEIE